MAIHNKPPFWRRRGYQVTAAIVGSLIVAGLGANFYLTQEYQPAAAVSQYLTALEGKDAQAAWDAVEIEPPKGPIDTSLVDLSALRRAFAQGSPDIKAFDVTGTRYLDPDQTSAAVDLTYTTSVGSRQTSFNVVRGSQRHFGIYPSWLVLIQPAVIKLTLPPAAKVVSVDGHALQVSAEHATVAVWPLRHRIDFPGSALLTTQTVAVDLFDKAGTDVSAQPALTGTGRSDAISAIKAAFAQCAAQTSLQPAGCPQRLDGAWTNSGSWSLVGDPTQDVVVAFDQQTDLVASGHYQMVVAYQNSNGTLHAAAGGGFVAVLDFRASDLTVASLSGTNEVPALQRPAPATDAAIEAAVSKGMAACAASRAAAPPDCPQQFFFPDASILGWTVTGDPLAGATVIFDPTSGVFTVHGNFEMTVRYQLTGYPETESSSTTSYDASVLWEASGPKLITISGGYE